MTDNIRDRWFYTGFAVLCALTAVIGFGPRSYMIFAGEMANPPLTTHLHAITMGIWLALLTTQAALIGSGRWELHQKLGLLAVVLAPVMVLLMLTVVIRTHDPEYHVEAVTFTQVRRLSVFTLSVGLALLLREKDPQSHKRLMFLGTLVLLDAAFFRMTFLPTFGMERVIISEIYLLFLLVPLTLYDVVTLKRLHKTTLAGLVIFVSTAIVIGLLW